MRWTCDEAERLRRVQRCGITQVLPFVSETLQPVQALQPAQEGTQAAFDVVRLLIIVIIRLLQKQPSGWVCVCMCLPK